MNKMGMKCYVSGRVQNVWYRASAQKTALNLGITGYARNLDDGRVEVFAYGSTEQLESLFNWLKEGPTLAKVEECSREPIQWQAHEGFQVL